MAKYKCTICGYVYDDDKESIKFEDLPSDWSCPICGAPKAVFEKVEEVQAVEPEAQTEELIEDEEDLKELSYGQLSLICSNLGKGCEKEYKYDDAKLFFKLADEFKRRAGVISSYEMDEVEDLLNQDFKNYTSGKKLCEENHDRGALRALVWNEKVSRMALSVLSQYKTKGEALLGEGINIYVCEICGFIYIGKELPKVCPVCKVPSSKMVKVTL